MNPWLETSGVLLLGGAGVALGRWSSRLPRPYWALGYFVPLALIVLIGLAHRFRTLEFHPPFRWLMAGRAEFALTALIATMMLTTPLSRLRRRDRGAICLLMVWLVFQVAAWPFLAPAFNHSRLAALKTRIDSDGVCLQNTDYTCGPAAAVTALRRLGIPAEEGEIAILCKSSAALGTPPDILSGALQNRYGPDGLICDYRAFESVNELKGTGCTLALMKFAFLLDHYVAVLGVDDQNVVVGDPLNGKQTLTRGEFAARWRFVGVTLKRGPSPTPVRLRSQSRDNGLHGRRDPRGQIDSGCLCPQRQIMFGIRRQGGGNFGRKRRTAKHLGTLPFLRSRGATA
jgi:hypothetical protein